MSTVYASDIVNFNMTLTLASIDKDKNIVIGADSSHGVYRSDGSGEFDMQYDAKKIYEVITDRCSILVAGDKFKADRIDQFLDDFIFCVNDRGFTQVAEIAQELQRNAMRLLSQPSTIHPQGYVNLMLVGFNDRSPKVFHFKSENGFPNVSYGLPYLADGDEAATELVSSLFEQLGVNGQTSLDILRNAVTTAFETVKEVNENVGGETHIQALMRPEL